MLVTVFCAPRDRPETTFALDVSPELELRDFVALCELESGIPAGEIQISYVEQLLKDPTRALGTYGLKDGDVVVLRQADRRPPPTQPAFPGLPRIDFSSIAVPGTSSSSSQRPATRPQQQAPQPQHEQHRSPQPPAPVTPRGSGAGSSPQGLDDPALLQQMLLANPHELSLLKERNPPLADALLSGDLERFTKVLLEQQQDRARREQERIRLLTADPFDLEAQAKIEEDIRQHNVEENMTIAMEEAPESFGQVVMLYINCRVNGHPVKAFVDSGAQMTIMSQACAERCNIMRLVDRRWAGIAKGVGTQKIIGRVHLAQVQIEGDYLPCSFSILEDQPMDMLLGLDMLKRHQCSIDLKKNVLLIGTTGTETHFLPEAELPECARLAYGAEGREDARPDEIADRELAEALQRSVQESDTADGQTTSQKSPPFPLLTPYNQQLSPSSSSSQSLSSGRPQSLALDRSKSAPATTHQAPTSGQCQGQPGFQGLPGPSSQADDTTPTAPQVHPRILPAPTNSTLSTLPTTSTKDPPTYTPAAERAVIGTSIQGDPEGEVLPTADMGDESEGCPSTDDLPTTYTHATERATSGSPPPGHPEGEVPTADMGAELEGAVNCPLLPHAEELSPVQPMEQEEDGSAATDARHTCQRAPGQQSQEGDARSEQHPHQLVANNPLSLTLGSCPTESASRGESSMNPEPCSAEMESPTAVQSSTVPSERDQPEGERCSRSDNVPSLAAALMELHELLVSNSRTLSQDRSTSCSPSSHPFRQDADGLDGNPSLEPTHTLTPENTQPNPCIAITACAEPSDAKANHAAVLDEGPSECLDPGSSDQEEQQVRDMAEAAEGREPPPQCPDSSWDRRADRCGQEDASNVGVSGPEPEGRPALTGDLEFREPPEGQLGRGVADGRASGTDAPDTLGLQPEASLQSPLSMAVGSPEEDSGILLPSLLPLAQAPQSTSPALPLSAPHPFTEQFPAEHIQRIQAAGFSAREAAEALEQAHGIVELALLALLARSITVPS